MKNLHSLNIAISAFLLTLFSTELIAQQRTLIGIFNQGTYLSPEENPPAIFGGCSCGNAAYNCICGFVDYTDVLDVPRGQIPVFISSQVVSGNTLQIKFKEKIKMELKTNDFVQKEAVVINSSLAKSLGFKSIKILPGKYIIKEGNSVVFNIEHGEPYNTRGWGWIAFIIVLIILISVISGQSSAPSGSTTSQSCDDCRKDMAWFNSLPGWKKAIYHAWYITRWTICKASGCI